MPMPSQEQGIRVYSGDTIEKICLEAGADDVGLVDLDRQSVRKEKEGGLQVLHAYPLTRSIIAIIAVNNRENIQSSRIVQGKQAL
ncbi:MAG TPA: hypothetical protein VEK32_13095 [Thermodesulfobacteriota bacterium]|nr:hypothetical protein [Thermodesulfobacteriota bacterium]